MLLAAECMCASPREFERGWCHRCGRLIAVDPDFMEGLDDWLRLDLKIEYERLKLRELASELGLSDGEYAAWLRSELGMRDDPALSEENATPAASQGVTTAVSG